MQLYCGLTPDFLEADAQRDIVRRLQVSFFEYYRFQPSQSEKNSWHNSLHALAAQIKRAKLFDQGIILEMQLPLTSRRLDCILTGHSEGNEERAVLIELKQWTDAAAAEEDRCVEVYYGSAGMRVVEHPSYQARDYASYLRQYRRVFYEEAPVTLLPCAWLHNFQRDPDSTLLDESKFGDALREAPLFAASDSDGFADYLEVQVGGGKGEPILKRIVESRFAPSKKLMEHTAAMIKGHPTYVLLDEQRVAYEKIMLAARRATNRSEKRTVIIVEGGPGTGKSVIALNVMADLLQQGKNVQHATGSKAFTENLRKALGRDAGLQFRYFNSFTDTENAEIDVLICDEAHRVRETSNNRFTPAARRSGTPQVEELINAAKVTAFFIDDQQVVRPGEIGSTYVIEEAARELGAKVVREKLEAQFRCAGSDEYIDWLDQLLGVRETDVISYDPDGGFELRIFDSPAQLDAEIKSKAADGLSARLTAGFCWPWSDPDREGLVDDVVIGSFRRPWNAKPEAGKLPSGIPKSNYWATDPNGLGQVGCVYTAQGFEFDYAGVIWGPDLIYREAQGWIGNRKASFDPPVKRAKDDHFLALVKNTYRVLLTRGLRGCFVYFTDAETREYVASRLGYDEELAAAP